MRTQAPLFWRWSSQPGNLFPLRQSGIFTMTQGDAIPRTIWRYDRVIAQGSVTMIEQIWKDLI